MRCTNISTQKRVEALSVNKMCFKIHVHKIGGVGGRGGTANTHIQGFFFSQCCTESTITTEGQNGMLNITALY